MFEVKILIPVRANDGTEFSAAHHHVFELQLRQLFGGFSLEPLTIRGEWVDEDGIVYQDDLLSYVVFPPSIAKGNDVAAAAAFAKTHYAQLAIAVRYLGLSEVL